MAGSTASSEYGAAAGESIEVTPAARQSYLHFFQQHLSQLRPFPQGAINEYDHDRRQSRWRLNDDLGPSPKPSLYPSTWTRQEKSVFFAALTRHSRYRPDMIAFEIGTKNEVEVEWYLDGLELASNSNKRMRQRSGTKNRMEGWLNGMAPAAVEVPDEWTEKEELLAAHVQAEESRLSLQAKDKFRNKQVQDLLDFHITSLDAFRINTDLPTAPSESAQAQKSRRNKLEKERRISYPRRLQEAREMEMKWSVMDGLSEVDPGRLKLLDLLQGSYEAEKGVGEEDVNCDEGDRDISDEEAGEGQDEDGMDIDDPDQNNAETEATDSAPTASASNHAPPTGARGRSYQTAQAVAARQAQDQQRIALLTSKKEDKTITAAEKVELAKTKKRLKASQTYREKKIKEKGLADVVANGEIPSWEIIRLMRKRKAETEPEVESEAQETDEEEVGPEELGEEVIKDGADEEEYVRPVFKNIGGPNAKRIKFSASTAVKTIKTEMLSPPPSPVKSSVSSLERSKPKKSRLISKRGIKESMNQLTERAGAEFEDYKMDLREDEREFAEARYTAGGPPKLDESSYPGEVIRQMEEWGIDLFDLDGLASKCRETKLDCQTLRLLRAYLAHFLARVMQRSIYLAELNNKAANGTSPEIDHWIVDRALIQLGLKTANDGVLVAGGGTQGGDAQDIRLQLQHEYAIGQALRKGTLPVITDRKEDGYDEEDELEERLHDDEAAKILEEKQELWDRLDSRREVEILNGIYGGAENKAGPPGMESVWPFSRTIARSDDLTESKAERTNAVEGSEQKREENDSGGSSKDGESESDKEEEDSGTEGSDGAKGENSDGEESKQDDESDSQPLVSVDDTSGTTSMADVLQRDLRIARHECENIARKIQDRDRLRLRKAERLDVHAKELGLSNGTTKLSEAFITNDDSDDADTMNDSLISGEDAKSGDESETATSSEESSGGDESD